jgi:hypothetical protein
MPNKDTYHDVTIQVLRADGWRIVREHALVSTDTRRLFIDILAERLSDQSRALFEVKDFDSPVETLAIALGKYQLYQYALQFSGLDVPLFLAVPQLAYQGILSESIGLYASQLAKFKLMIFDPHSMRINQWI